MPSSGTNAERSRLPQLERSRRSWSGADHCFPISNTTPLPNVPLALSQGTFDGLITTHETVASGQFWESGIRHALEDHQFIGEYIPIVSRAFWEKLPPELRQVFTNLWRENVQGYRANMAAAQSRASELVQAHGINIVLPSPDA